jgi:ubiquinone/menaquinone biosynthesis C-methylase UbiE
VSDHYDHIAPWYDLLLEPFIRRLRRTFAEWVAQQQPARVLDLSCGTGRQLSLLPETITAWGVDLSPAMLAQARRQAAGRCLRGDVTAVPFPDETFDLICSQFALHEKPAAVVERELAEVRRLLTPHGRFAVVDYALPLDGRVPARWLHWGIRRIERLAGEEHYQNYRDWMDHGGLIEILQDAGWRPVHEQRFYRGNILFCVFRIPDGSEAGG